MFDELTSKQRARKIQEMQSLHYNSGVSYAMLSSMFGGDAEEIRQLIEDREIERHRQRQCLTLH